MFPPMDELIHQESMEDEEKTKEVTAKSVTQSEISDKSRENSCTKYENHHPSNEEKDYALSVEAENEEMLKPLERCTDLMHGQIAESEDLENVIYDEIAEEYEKFYDLIHYEKLTDVGNTHKKANWKGLALECPVENARSSIASENASENVVSLRDLEDECPTQRYINEVLLRETDTDADFDTDAKVPEEADKEKHWSESHGVVVSNQKVSSENVSGKGSGKLRFNGLGIQECNSQNFYMCNVVSTGSVWKCERGLPDEVLPKEGRREIVMPETSSSLHDAYSFEHDENIKFKDKDGDDHSFLLEVSHGHNSDRDDHCQERKTVYNSSVVALCIMIILIAEHDKILRYLLLNAYRGPTSIKSCLGNSLQFCSGNLQGTEIMVFMMHPEGKDTVDSSGKVETNVSTNGVSQGNTAELGQPPGQNSTQRTWESQSLSNQSTDSSQGRVSRARQSHPNVSQNENIAASRSETILQGHSAAQHQSVSAIAQSENKSESELSQPQSNSHSAAQHQSVSAIAQSENKSESELSQPQSNSHSVAQHQSASTIAQPENESESELSEPQNNFEIVSHSQSQNYENIPNVQTIPSHNTGSQVSSVPRHRPAQPSTSGSNNSLCLLSISHMPVSLNLQLHSGENDVRSITVPSDDDNHGTIVVPSNASLEARRYTHLTYPFYADPASRWLSFASFSGSSAERLRLADRGFFYEGNIGFVRCYICGEQETWTDVIHWNLSTNNNRHPHSCSVHREWRNGTAHHQSASENTTLSHSAAQHQDASEKIPNGHSEAQHQSASENTPQSHSAAQQKSAPENTPQSHSAAQHQSASENTPPCHSAAQQQSVLAIAQSDSRFCQPSISESNNSLCLLSTSCTPVSLNVLWQSGENDVRSITVPSDDDNQETVVVPSNASLETRRYTHLTYPFYADPTSRWLSFASFSGSSAERLSLANRGFFYEVPPLRDHPLVPSQRMGMVCTEYKMIMNNVCTVLPFLSTVALLLRDPYYRGMFQVESEQLGGRNPFSVLLRVADLLTGSEPKFSRALALWIRYIRGLEEATFDVYTDFDMFGMQLDNIGTPFEFRVQSECSNPRCSHRTRTYSHPCTFLLGGSSEMTFQELIQSYFASNCSSCGVNGQRSYDFEEYPPLLLFFNLNAVNYFITSSEDIPETVVVFPSRHIYERILVTYMHQDHCLAVMSLQEGHCFYNCNDTSPTHQEFGVLYPFTGDPDGATIQVAVFVLRSTNL